MGTSIGGFSRVCQDDAEAARGPTLESSILEIVLEYDAGLRLKDERCENEVEQDPAYSG
jgi:hypothetical protein